MDKSEQPGDIRTAKGRAKLPIDQDAIHWSRHAMGRYIGFRKTSATNGTWWARLRDPATGTQYYENLTELAEHTAAKRYDAALAAAVKWFQQADQGVTPHRKAVADVCAAYVSRIRRTDAKKADRTAADFRRLIADDPIATIEVAKLKRADLEAWRDRRTGAPNRMGRGKRLKDTPRRESTMNREMVPLRAALNQALEDQLVASDIAWRVALKAIPKADKRRDIYLDRVDRTRLLEAASDEIRPFLRGLALLPLRPGALAGLTAGDFNARLRTLRIGEDKNGGERWITLPPATADFFKEHAKGKLPRAPLLGRADGRKWVKDDWKWDVKDAVRAAGLPEAASAYTLRHSVITDLVVAGLDLLTIAQISDTSVQMIQEHYGHLRQDHAEEALAGLAL